MSPSLKLWEKRYWLFLSLCVVSICELTGATESRAEDSSPIKLIIHYANGLPASSSSGELPQIRLNKNYSHIYLEIRNISKDEQVLRFQNCHTASNLKFEFKSALSSKDILTAKDTTMCTGNPMIMDVDTDLAPKFRTPG